MSDVSGECVGTIRYYRFGLTRSGSVLTDKKFTGQRLDNTGLYYFLVDPIPLFPYNPLKKKRQAASAFYPG
jgi:hypothetical protein